MKRWRRRRGPRNEGRDGRKTRDSYGFSRSHLSSDYHQSKYPFWRRHMCCSNAIFDCSLPEIAHTECTQSVGVFLPTSSDYISYHSIYSSSNIFLNIFSSSKMSAAGASSLPLLRGMHACLVSKMRPWIICHLCSFPVIRKSNPSTPPALARYPSLAHPPGTHAHPRAMTASAPCMVHARWCVVRGAGSPHSQTECT